MSAYKIGLASFVSCLFLSQAGCGGGHGSGQHGAIFAAINLNADSLTASPDGKTLYAAGDITDPLYSGKILSISSSNPTTIQTSSGLTSPVALGVTVDGKYLLAGTPTLVATLGLPKLAPITVASLSPAPMQTLGVAPILKTNTDFVVTVNTGTALNSLLYVGTTSVGTAEVLGDSVVADPGGSIVYGVNTATGVFSVASVTAAGIGTPRPVNTWATGGGFKIHWANGVLLADDGSVIDPNSGTVTSKLFITATHSIAIPVAGQNKAYMLVWNTLPQAEILGFNLTTKTQTSTTAVVIPNLIGMAVGGVSLAKNGLAFYTQGETGQEVVIVRHLP